MKKRFTKLIIPLLCIMGGALPIWGQNVQLPTWHDSGGPYTAARKWCDGTYTIQTWTWNADNNFGPGEKGTITPIGNGASSNKGTHTAETTNRIATLNPMSTGSGIITVGGTDNIVMNVHSDAHITESCSHYVDWTPSAHGSDSYVSNWGNWNRPHSEFAGRVSVNSRVDLYAGDAPNVPDGTGLKTIDGNPAAYTHETKITVDGHTTANPNTPWQLQVFNFLENKWYYNNYSLKKSSANECVYTQWIKYMAKDKWETGGGGYWDWQEHTLTATCNHKSLYYERTLGTGSNSLPARIVLTAGSHVQLTGHNIGTPLSTQSIAHGSLGSTTAYLNLPATHYTLMNDENVTLGSIVYNSNGGNAVDPVLGTDAVFGINKQLDKDLKTSTTGGTILIGSTTDGTSQGKITIQPAATANANPYGFSARTDCNTVYTGTWIPMAGTANVGNYGDHDITIDGAMKLPTNTMAAGKLQVFNMKKNLEFKNLLPTPVGSSGNVLLLAAHTLTMNGNAHTTTLTSSGSVVLMGSKIQLQKPENITIGTGATGNYDVIAYADVHKQNPNTWEYGKAPSVGIHANAHGTNNYAFCGAVPTEQIPTAWPLITPSVGSRGGQDYVPSCNRLPDFLNISYISAEDEDGGTIHSADGSTVTVNAAGNARWQATSNISTAANKDYNWTIGASATGNAEWLAGGNITLGTNNKALWTSTSTTANKGMFWNAGGNINTQDVEAVWTTVDNDMIWRAGGAINAGPTLDKIEWTSTGSGNMRWEAGNINVKNGTNALKFQQDGTGYTNWTAVQDIDVTPNDGKILFVNNSTGKKMTWWAGRNIITAGEDKLVRFEQIGANNAHNNEWFAGNDIRTKTLIEFENSVAANTHDMIWQAGQNILTNYNATSHHGTSELAVKFTNKGKGHMIWHAGDDIDTRSKTEFLSDAGSEGHMIWYAGNDIHTRLGDNASQLLGTGVDFTQKGKGRTIWQAVRDITTHNAVKFDWTAAIDDAASIALLAGRNITLGGVNDTEYDLNNSLKNQFQIETGANSNDYVTLHSKDGYIRTNAQVDIKRNNPDAAVTKFWAGCGTFNPTNNIEIENVFNYTETAQTGGALVHWYAENDILSNTVCDNDRPAPITFDVTGAAGTDTKTKWEAERNINTKGRVDFKYRAATEADSLVLLSRAGYIQTERPVTFQYDSDKPISVRAEDDRHDPASHNSVKTNANATGRRGNIHFFDSVDFNRDNTGNGLTEIKAENHIWTAMVNYVDKQSAGNSMDIISHKGDIYMGYNDGKTTGYDWKFYISNPALHDWYVTQKAPSAGCDYPVISAVSYDKNRFTYSVPALNQTGHLWIKAGWEELTDMHSVPNNDGRDAGGNIYFTHINVNQDPASNHPTEITIPFSGLWKCGRSGDSSLYNRKGGAMEFYENHGIIGGVAQCAIERGYPSGANTHATDTGLIYRGAQARLLVDAGLRGNIIINNGTYLNFQDKTGNTEFRTRFGDINMRYPFDVDSVRGSLLFLASNDDPKKLELATNCSCEEQRNNVYLQDFRVVPVVNNGSIFVGADNNIKLNYGGLKDIGTQRDPFLSRNMGYPCGDRFHCDADTSENQARDLILNFYQTTVGTPANIVSGGFAAVASDRIDAYKNLIYNGGSGSGLSAVPNYNTLHGEAVAGYGLYIKTQGDKKNWNKTNHGLDRDPNPWIGAACNDDACTMDFLHQIARVTFHADARIYAENQRVLIASPVLDTYGNADYNTMLRAGSKTDILLQADSLIYHDSLIIDGPKTRMQTWTSGMERDMPIIKLGHQRFTPPAPEGAPCPDCFTHKKDPRTRAGAANRKLDSIFVTFRNDATVKRLHALVSDHAIISFLTDSFDHINGKPTQNAKFYTDIFKVRNHVELFTKPDHTTDGHFELCSEEQMATKDYAGVYARHLHMEPIAPTCSDFRFSQFWFPYPTLDVIPTSTFGGFGWIHADVHVEIGANLFPGFASLGVKGNCYEQRAGVLKMKDLRLDKGANVKVTIGEADAGNSFAENYTCPQTGEKLELGRYADCLIVDSLSIYGSQFIDVDMRSAISLEPGQSKCYPIIQYKKVGKDNLNNLKLRKLMLTEKDHPSIEGTYYLTLDMDTVCKVVYVCIATVPNPEIHRPVTIPAVSGVTTNPVPGRWHVKSGNDFRFKAKYSTAYPLKVMTGRVVDGVPEEIYGWKNGNGEYEYVVPRVLQDIVLTIGPDPATKESANDEVAGAAVWAVNNRLYIRVDADDVASIYSVAGQLVRQLDVQAGTTTTPLELGVYVITLKDGSVHKVIVK